MILGVTMTVELSLVYLPIKAHTHEQNNLKNTNTTKHIYGVIQLYVYLQCFVLADTI